MALMRDVVFEATSFVIVTHDPAIAASTDKQYELSNGQLIEHT
jgi:ABC-type lipoprotein export system ATPase subunit